MYLPDTISTAQRTHANWAAGSKPVAAVAIVAVAVVAFVVVVVAVVAVVAAAVSV